MKPASTLAMLALLLGLGAYVFFYVRQPVPAESAKAETQILQLEPAQVRGFSLEKAGQRLVAEKNAKGQWHLLEPQKTLADAALLDTFVDHLKDWPAAQVVEPNLNASEKKDFGLEPPRLKLELKTSQGVRQFLLGNKTPINSGYYVLSEDGKQLLLSYVNLPEEMERLLAHPPVPSASPSPPAQK